MKGGADEGWTLYYLLQRYPYRLLPALVQPGSLAAELYLENSECLMFFSTLAWPPEQKASPSFSRLLQGSSYPAPVLHLTGKHHRQDVTLSEFQVSLVIQYDLSVPSYLARCCMRISSTLSHQSFYFFHCCLVASC